MTDREWRGQWWLPSQPEEAVAGTLVESESDGAVVLNLIGGFSIEVRTPVDDNQIAVSSDLEFPMILGMASGKRFTLLECTATHTGGGFLGGSITEQNIGVHRALRGIHLSDPDDEMFDAAVVNVEYLLGWMHETAFEASIELNEWKWTGNQTATTKPVGDLTATHGPYTYTLSVVFNQFQIEDRPRANERSLANREWAEMTIRSATPTTFAGFDQSAKAIMDLMTLVAHAPAGVVRETVQLTPEVPHAATGEHVPKHVEVMGRQIHHPRPGGRETARTDYLFTLADIEFSEVLPNWLALHERAWLACSMLFGLSYIPDGYTSSRLLTAATAAESLHRALFPDATRIPEEQFNALRQGVMEAFAGSDPEAKAARRFLGDGLSNHVTYKERVLHLATMPDDEAVATLISDQDKWAKYLKDQRNGLAHGDHGRLGPDGGRMVFDTLEVTRALLGLVLLNEIGLLPDIQQRAVRMQYLNFVATEFNKALRGL